MRGVVADRVAATVVDAATVATVATVAAVATIAGPFVETFTIFVVFDAVFTDVDMMIAYPCLSRQMFFKF